jgi:hypothetical protein
MDAQRGRVPLGQGQRIGTVAASRSHMALAATHLPPLAVTRTGCNLLRLAAMRLLVLLASAQHAYVPAGLSPCTLLGTVIQGMQSSGWTLLQLLAVRCLSSSACSDTNTPCSNQVPAEIALKICQKIKVRPCARCRSPASAGDRGHSLSDSRQHTHVSNWMTPACAGNNFFATASHRSASPLSYINGGSY